MAYKEDNDISNMGYRTDWIYKVYPDKVGTDDILERLKYIEQRFNDYCDYLDISLDEYQREADGDLMELKFKMAVLEDNITFLWENISILQSQTENNKIKNEKRVKAAIIGYAVFMEILIIYSALMSFITTADLFALFVVAVFSLLLILTVIATYRFFKGSKTP